jgi:hypothetical protein
MSAARCDAILFYGATGDLAETVFARFASLLRYVGGDYVESLKAYAPADLALERIDELVDTLVRADALRMR